VTLVNGSVRIAAESSSALPAPVRVSDLTVSYIADTSHYLETTRSRINLTAAANSIDDSVGVEVSVRHQYSITDGVTAPYFIAESVKVNMKCSSPVLCVGVAVTFADASMSGILNNPAQIHLTDVSIAVESLSWPWMATEASAGSPAAIASRAVAALFHGAPPTRPPCVRGILVRRRFDEATYSGKTSVRLTRLSVLLHHTALVPETPVITAADATVDPLFNSTYYGAVRAVSSITSAPVAGVSIEAHPGNSDPARSHCLETALTLCTFKEAMSP
jgi:hypothetical protein